MKKSLISASLSLSLLSGAALAQNATALIEKHTKEATEALEKYIDSNPEAKDKSEAVNFLVDAYGRIGATERRAELLLIKYGLLPKGKDLNPQEFFGTLQEIFEGQMDSGDKSAAKATIAQAKKDIAAHPQAERFGAFLDQMSSKLAMPGVGDTMDLKFTSLKGEEIDLAKMKDKVVLVDFWATWCGPCIAELPVVKKTYADYKEKGFEILAISLDQDKKKLEDFIKENDMPWPQAFDGKGWQNEIAKKFGIASIPATFLVGKDGKIVGSNLRGDALPEAVAEALK